MENISEWLLHILEMLMGETSTNYTTNYKTYDQKWNLQWNTAQNNHHF